MGIVVGFEAKNMKMMKWISIDSKLPSIYKTVIVYVKDVKLSYEKENIFTGKYNGNLVITLIILLAL